MSGPLGPHCIAIKQAWGHPVLNRRRAAGQPVVSWSVSTAGQRHSHRALSLRGCLNVADQCTFLDLFC